MTSKPTGHDADSVAERLIVALDVPEIAAAETLVAELEERVSFFKIGLQLHLAEGLDRFVRRLIDAGKKVFIDFKYYDIDQTVRNAVARASELGVSFVTVHWNANNVRAALEGKGGSDLKVLCVTLLTSLDRQDVKDAYGYEGPLEDFVTRRAAKALEWGSDGVIAAPTDVSAIRGLAPSERFAIVSPGIRPSGSVQDDQKRIATPAAAIAAGADYLVVGRPIVQQPDPVRAAAAIIEDMRRGAETIPDP